MFFKVKMFVVRSEGVRGEMKDCHWMLDAWMLGKNKCFMGTFNLQ
jgi:hypothetical protein